MFQVHAPSRTTRTFTFSFTICFTRPLGLLPISIVFRGKTLIQTSGLPPLPPTAPTLACPSLPPSTAHEYISQLHPSLHWAIGQCFFPPDLSGLLTDLQTCYAAMASDGSVTSSNATQGWVLLGTRSHQRAHGHGFVLGGGQPSPPFVQKQVVILWLCLPLMPC